MDNYSPKFTMTYIDWQKWFKNTGLFLAPVAVIYLAFVVAQIELDGFQINDFVPNAITIGSMILYILNTALDFLRKFVPERFN